MVVIQWVMVVVVWGGWWWGEHNQPQPVLTFAIKITKSTHLEDMRPHGYFIYFYKFLEFTDMPDKVTHLCA